MIMSIFDESGKSGKTFARPIKNQPIYVYKFLKCRNFLVILIQLTVSFKHDSL